VEGSQSDYTMRYLIHPLNVDMRYRLLGISTSFIGYIYTHTHTHTHSRVSFCDGSFCDGSFYDDSLLQPLSSRTEPPHLWCITVATQTSFLYLVRFKLFSGVHVFLLFLFQCSSFKFNCDFSTHQKDRKEEKPKHLTLHSFRRLKHGLGLLQQNKNRFD